jgi:hypothetical protein
VASPVRLTVRPVVGDGVGHLIEKHGPTTAAMLVGFASLNDPAFGSWDPAPSFDVIRPLDLVIPAISKSRGATHTERNDALKSLL